MRCYATCMSAPGYRSFIGIATLFLVMVLSGCTDPDDQHAEDVDGKPYTHIAAAKPIELQKGYEATRRFVGSVQVKEQTQLGFDQPGKISEIYVDEGEKVLAGDVLAHQETLLLDGLQKELEARQLEVATEINLAEITLARFRELASKGYASQQSLDELVSKRMGLNAKEQHIRAQLGVNRFRLYSAVLTAPFDSIVNRRYIGSGEVVGRGAPVFSLLILGPAEVKIGVPVRFLSMLEKQQHLTIIIAGARFQAELITKGFSVDPLTRTVQLRLQLPESAQVVNGEMAHLLINEKIHHDGFWVPLTALTDGLRGLWNVYVLEKVPEDGLYKLESRDVRLVHAEHRRAYVSGSLLDGDLVLNKGLHRLVPGQLVRLKGRTTQPGAEQ